MRYTVCMSTPSKYILIEESKNMNDDSSNDEVGTSNENEVDSTNALNSQGIFIQEADTLANPSQTKPLNDFFKEIYDEAGIEIVSSGKKSEDLD